MIADRRFALLLLCFFVSGVAALIYETTWTREFTFVFGTSDLAVATVLAGYMAGLALGAAAAARWGPRIRRPILAYALLELGVAVSALCVPPAIAGSRELYRAVFGGGMNLTDEGGLLRCVFYLATSMAILIVPTSLMGATLPLLIRHAVRNDAQLGPRVGFLYTANTLGAVCGTVLAAFVLLRYLGLRGSIWVAIGANVLVFVGGALLARRAPAVETATDLDRTGRSSRDRTNFILPIMLLSGAASFTYEVLWTRLLSQTLGGSVYAFATMLAAFLTGIALGSWIASRPARTRRLAARAFGWAQVATAVLSLAAFLAVDRVALLTAGSAGFLANACVAAAVLLPSAVCMGATFPLAVRILAPDEAAATTASARVYAWNTAGAIIGAIGTGFVLLPVLEFSGTISLAIAVNLALAVVAGTTLCEPRTRVAWVAAAGLAIIAFARPPAPWTLLRTSPISGPASASTTYFAVGRGATVLLSENAGGWELRTNGLREALIRPRGGRAAEAKVLNWLSTVPSLARPDATSMLVVGLGGGVVLETIPQSIETIDVVEIEPEVVNANRAVADKRAVNPLADPRVRVIVNDVRGALTLTDARYDIVVSQPSHPWTAAASHLFTREFFELIGDHLTEDGVLAQWMGLQFVDQELMRSIVATLVDVFPHVRVYQPVQGAVILLASPRPLEVEATAVRGLAVHPREYRLLGFSCPEDIAAGLVLDDAGARRFGETAPVITDDRNYLAMRSPLVTRRIRTGTDRSFDVMFQDEDPLLGPTPGLDRSVIVRRLVSRGFHDRAQRVAEAIRDPLRRELALAIVPRGSGRSPAAQRVIEEALRRNPAYEAVVDGRRLESAGDWEGVRALELRLAAMQPCDLGYARAVRLRAGWRLSEEDPALAAEAVELLDGLLAKVKMPAYLIARARASARAGCRSGAIRTLFEIARGLKRLPSRRAIASRALEVIAQLDAEPGEPDPVLDELRASFERMLEQ